MVCAIVGLLFNAVQILWAHNLSELGVGTSAAIMMDTLFWIGGSMVFGLGAILTKEDTAPPAQVDPTDQGQQAISAALNTRECPYCAETIKSDISQEISNVVDSGASASANASVNQPPTPTISERKVKSQITVTSGQMVLLAGLVAETQSKTRSGVPVLDQLPIVGGAFGSSGKQRQRTELIILIKPQIIHNSVDASRVAEELRAKMRGGRIDAVSLPNALQIGAKELTNAAQGANVPLSATDSAHQKMLEALNGLKGDDFRKEYFSDQVSAHKDAVSLFNRYGSGGDNAKLKSWATATLPALEHHLEMARGLYKNS